MVRGSLSRVLAPRKFQLRHYLPPADLTVPPPKGSKAGVKAEGRYPPRQG